MAAQTYEPLSVPSVVVHMHETPSMCSLHIETNGEPLAHPVASQKATVALQHSSAITNVECDQTHAQRSIHSDNEHQEAEQPAKAIPNTANLPASDDNLQTPGAKTVLVASVVTAEAASVGRSEEIDFGSKITSRSTCALATVTSASIEESACPLVPLAASFSHLTYGKTTVTGSASGKASGRPAQPDTKTGLVLSALGPAPTTPTTSRKPQSTFDAGSVFDSARASPMTPSSPKSDGGAYRNPSLAHKSKVQVPTSVTQTPSACTGLPSSSIGTPSPAARVSAASPRSLEASRWSKPASSNSAKSSEKCNIETSRTTSSTPRSIANALTSGIQISSTCTGLPSSSNASPSRVAHVAAALPRGLETSEWSKPASANPVKSSESCDNDTGRASSLTQQSIANAPTSVTQISLACTGLPSSSIVSPSAPAAAISTSSSERLETLQTEAKAKSPEESDDNASRISSSRQKREGKVPASTTRKSSASTRLSFSSDLFIVALLKNAGVHDKQWYIVPKRARIAEYKGQSRATVKRKAECDIDVFRPARKTKAPRRIGPWTKVTNCGEA